MSASTSFDASISGSAAAADVSTPPPSSPSSSTDAAAAAAARREARKARILGKGSDRLAKLTKQARGDEAEMLYPSTPPPAAAAAAAASPAQSKSALTTTAATGEEDPEEIDISNQARMDDEMQRAMQMFQQRQQQQGQQGQGSPMPQDPFAQMMAALTGGGGGMGGMGGGPPGQDGMNGGGMPDLSQLFAAMQQQQQPGAGGNGAGVPPGFPGAPAAKVSPASWLSTRLFSLLHTLVFLALGYFAIASALGGGGSSAPASTQADEFSVDDTAAVLGTGHNEASQRLQSWASLAYYRPSTASSGLSSGLQSRHFDIDGAWLGVKGALPLFHLFLLIEVLLQSVRFLFSSPLSSHPQAQQQMAGGGSPLSMLLQFLPPPIRFAVVTGKRWLSLLGTCVDDIAVLVFALGCGTIWCAAQVKA